MYLVLSKVREYSQSLSNQISVLQSACGFVGYRSRLVLHHMTYIDLVANDCLHCHIAPAKRLAAQIFPSICRVVKTSGDGIFLHSESAQFYENRSLADTDRMHGAPSEQLPDRSQGCACLLRFCDSRGRKNMVGILLATFDVVSSLATEVFAKDKIDLFRCHNRSACLERDNQRLSHWRFIYVNGGFDTRKQGKTAEKGAKIGLSEVKSTLDSPFFTVFLFSHDSHAGRVVTPAVTEFAIIKMCEEKLKGAIH
ncbi:MAG: hypothetical protein LUI61_01930 [Firmicutes bacterium]|nr:hypothetical protein [Bacillota bacterium]